MNPRLELREVKKKSKHIDEVRSDRQREVKRLDNTRCNRSVSENGRNGKKSKSDSQDQQKDK